MMPNFKRALVLAAALCALGQAQAAKFVLSPVLLNLNPAQSLTTATTITNTDGAPTAFTAEVLAWTQKDGQDVLVPTRDAIVSPMTFTVAPGKSQVVRVALRQAPNTASVTYRLILRQKVQPQPTSSGSVTITPRYVFSLPLFVERQSARAGVTISAAPRAEGTSLVFKNAGDGYGVFRNIKVTAAGRTFELGNQYVLSGATMELKLPAELKDVRALEFAADDANQKPVKVTLNVQ
ncbi:fimbrial biogenesis chaperone [Deinococcus arboris]|nr:fimbria/pilus periplasmic chaperone [Deinococcus arboris]